LGIMDPELSGGPRGRGEVLKNLKGEIYKSLYIAEGGGEFFVGQRREGGGA